MNQMQQMLMQAQKMQRELSKKQAELENKDFKISKAGMVEITIKGNHSVSEISIDKDALDPENKEMLEEAIKMAISEANEKIAKESEAINEEITGRAGLPF